MDFSLIEHDKAIGMVSDSKLYPLRTYYLHNIHIFSEKAVKLVFPVLTFILSLYTSTRTTD